MTEDSLIFTGEVSKVIHVPAGITFTVDEIVYVTACDGEREKDTKEWRCFVRGKLAEDVKGSLLSGIRVSVMGLMRNGLVEVEKLGIVSGKYTRS